MSAAHVAAATGAAIFDLPSRFMVDPATYRHGGDLGFNGIDFYVAGRGGVLGETEADVVSAAFCFFNPDSVRAAWDASAGVVPRRTAAEEFAGCAHRWAEAHLSDKLDAARLAELAGRVVASADPGGVPLFAGWRYLPVPESPKALALHHLNALRELRGGLHAGAVLAAGLRPIEAVAVSTPAMAAIHGWDEIPDAEPFKERWQEAEDATNVAMAVPLGELDDGELSELAELIATAHSTVDA